MLLGFAMGFHNGLAQEIIPDCPATTVMTMTIVKVSMNAANACQYYLASKSINKLYHIHKPTDYLSNMSTSTAKADKKLRSLYEPLLWFIVGAISGAAVNRVVIFFSLSLPLMLTLMITIDIYRASRYSFKPFISLADNVDGSKEESTDNPLQASVESKIPFDGLNTV